VSVRVNDRYYSSESIFSEETVRLIGCYEKVQKIIRGEVPPPETIELFLSNVCNFSCPHCLFREDHTVPRQGFIPLYLAQSILEEARHKGVKACEFSGGGEPLTHPEFVKLVQFASSLDYRIGIITNGSLLIRPGVAEVLARHCTWLRVSLDAGTPEVYSRVHGAGADFDQVLTGISHLLTARRTINGHLRVGVKFLLSKLNATDYDNALDLATQLRVDYIYFKAAVRCEYELSLPEKRKIFSQISKAAARRGTNHPKVGMFYRLTDVSPRCVLTPLHALVDYDGSIYVCPFFGHRREKHLIGNAKEGGLFAHWGGAKHKMRIAAINPEECNPDCPLAKFDPIIEFIHQQSDLFPFF
jgi:MoaA/NifB/PqqE/SkfB family radical SAM enzyme